MPRPNSPKFSENNNSVSKFISLLVNESSSNSSTTTGCQMSSMIENEVNELQKERL